MIITQQHYKPALHYLPLVTQLNISLLVFDVHFGDALTETGT